MDSTSAESDKPRGLFQCTECKRSYTRVDHLARHVRSHLQEKPFQCDVCHKGFGRPDLLKRHATCHDTDGNAKRQKRTLTQSSRVSQACKSCAYAKLKCEDEKPCKRCQNKGIACESNSDNRQHNNSSASAQPPGESSSEQTMPATHPFAAPSPTRSLPHAQVGPSPTAPAANESEQVNNQMPTPSTLLNGFEISGDEASITGTNFTPSIAPDPATLSSSLTVHENNFYDFLRNVLTPNNPGSFSPAHWDFEPRNVLDFTVEDDLSFDANDFGLLDAFNGKSFNPNDDFGPMPSIIEAPSAIAPAESTPSESGPGTETAEQWKAVYLSQQPNAQTRSYCLLDCLKDPKLAASFQGAIDHDFSALIILHGIWGMVWEYNQLQLTLKSDSGQYHSSLVMKHRHQELCQTVHHLRISIYSWPIAPAPEITIMLELQLLYLHLSIEDVQLFVGKEDQEEARRVFPALQQWMCDTYARTAVWQAARIVRAAKNFPRKQLRNFSAIAVYHASLALWTYGIIKQATANAAVSATCTSFPGGNAGGMDSNLGAVWLEGPETPDVQRFVTLGRGKPMISARGTSSSAAELVPLSDPEAVMNVVLDTLRRNFGVTGPGEMAEQESATGLLPPLLENLVQLMRDLGKAAGAVGR
ncbi:C2H2 type zinc finger domain protein [Neofusicoccum parvum]|nr:C2H2 type zinc finger domain protein [Neofusicoccum parvum]